MSFNLAEHMEAHEERAYAIHEQASSGIPDAPARRDRMIAMRHCAQPKCLGTRSAQLIRRAHALRQPEQRRGKA